MIYVKKKEKYYPFSKGILARSMTPTGLSLHQIYKVVGEIHRDLKEKGVSEIDSGEIHKQVCDELENQGAGELVKYYRISRKIARYNKPVIVLLGGPAGVGKSALSVELSRRLGVERIISSDTIREIMRYMVPRDLMPVLHESSFLAGTRLKNPLVKNKLIHGFDQQVSLVAGGIRAYIQRSKKEGLNAIINGVHLVPGLLDINFDDPSAFYFQYLIYLEDRDKHKERFYMRSEGSHRDPERYVRRLEEIWKLQSHMLELSNRSEVLAVENSEFELTVQTIMHDITTKLDNDKLSHEGLQTTRQSTPSMDDDISGEPVVENN